MIMKRVYIVVVNYNNPKDTIHCLESLSALSYANFRIILVDNASTDMSDVIFRSEIQKKKWHFLTYLRATKNGGYAAGNNLGIRFAMAQADMDYVWILNNDTIVTPDALGRMVSCMRRHPEAGLCGCVLRYTWDHERIQTCGGTYNKYLGTTGNIVHLGNDKHPDFINGASVLVSRKFIEDVGLLCEDYFLYYEEIDWALRGKAKGYGLVVADDTVVFHKEGASVGTNQHGKVSKSCLSDYYEVRSRLLANKKFYPQYRWIVYLGICITILKRLLRGQADRIPMILRLLLGIEDSSFERNN